MKRIKKITLIQIIKALIISTFIMFLILSNIDELGKVYINEQEINKILNNIVISSIGTTIIWGGVFILLVFTNRFYEKNKKI